MKNNTLTSAAVSRRRFLKTACASVSVAFMPSIATASENTLAEDDPAAVALGYKEDAATVDTAAFPRRAGDDGANQFCDNCALYAAGDDSEWGTCSIFPGKVVAAKGWCNAYAPKP